MTNNRICISVCRVCSQDRLGHAVLINNSCISSFNGEENTSTSTSTISNSKTNTNKNNIGNYEYNENIDRQWSTTPKVGSY